MNRREALHTLGTGSAFGFLGAVIVSTTQCSPTEAPAAERVGDPMLEALRWLKAHEVALDRMAFGDDDEAFEAYRVEKVDPIRKMIVEDRPAVATDEGARMALHMALATGTFICPFTHALVLQTLRYLERRSA